MLNGIFPKIAKFYVILAQNARIFQDICPKNIFAGFFFGGEGAASYAYVVRFTLWTMTTMYELYKTWPPWRGRVSLNFTKTNVKRRFTVASTYLLEHLFVSSLLSTIDSVCLSGCLSVCHAPSNCFFFCFSMESSHFGPSVLHVALYKTLFFDFWFRSPNPKNLLPKICTKSPISRLVWQIDRRCLGLPGGFRECRFNGTMQNVVGPTLVAMATKFGLGAEIQSPTGLYVILQ